MKRASEAGYGASALVRPARADAFFPAVARNAPCPCGSGRRFKACCGASVASVSTTLPSRLTRALALQQQGRLVEAQAIYCEVLEQAPQTADAAHMLGVIHLQMGNYVEALRRLRQAADLFEWKLPAVRHNLGLAIVALLAGRDRETVERLWEAYDDWRDSLQRQRRDVAPKVSVVIPSFNHAAYIESTLESVLRQTYPSIEIVVIDDGSSDDSADRIRASLRHSPHPTRFHARGNRGAAATINEAVASSSGEFINVLNSDDLFTTSRVATMVYEVAGTGVQWGFSRVAFIDQDGAALTPESSSRVADLGFLGDDVAARDAVSMSFLSGNAAVSTGALFFSRSLFDRLNGFRDLRYNHDWDFCLRASIVAEPLFVPTAQYQYRIHDANTILESVSAARSEADAMFSGFYAEALRTPAPQNPFAPVPAVWGARFFEQALGCGHAAILPPEVLRELVQRVATHDAGLSS